MSFKKIAILISFLFLICCIVVFGTNLITVGQLSGPKENILLTENLDENSSGKQVAILQSVLRTDPSLFVGQISGFYTVSTVDAVRRFQRKYLLPQTGTVDLATRIKFNEVFGQVKTAGDYLNGEKSDAQRWGVAEKVTGTRYGWSMKIENDFTMGNADEIFNALNRYRERKGKIRLDMSAALSAFAQQRAQELDTNGGVDEHIGFYSYIRNADNRTKLGFNRFGENTSCGYRMTASHLIEWIFAGDVPHDENQLNERWRYVGVGVKNTCVSLVFANNKK